MCFFYIHPNILFFIIRHHVFVSFSLYKMSGSFHHFSQLILIISLICGIGKYDHKWMITRVFLHQFKKRIKFPHARNSQQESNIQTLFVS